MLWSVACPALQYFSTLSHKRHDFRRTLLKIKPVFWFSLQVLSETFLILRRSERERERDQKCVLVCMESTRYSCHILMKLVMKQMFEKMFKCHISWKSFHWEPSRSMRTDAQTDMTKLIVTFRYFANAPKDENFGKGTWVLAIHFVNKSYVCICKRVRHSVDSVCVTVNTFCCLEMNCYKTCAGRVGLTGRPHFFPIRKSSFKTNYSRVSFYDRVTFSNIWL